MQKLLKSQGVSYVKVNGQMQRIKVTCKGKRGREVHHIQHRDQANPSGDVITYRVGSRCGFWIRPDVWSAA